MIVYYGGLPIRLCRILELSREPVMSDDGVAYLYTKVTLNAVGLINSQKDANNPDQGLGLSARREGDVIVDAVFPATNSVLTDTFVRHWMSIPRRTLILATDNTVLLRSPVLGMPCDAKTGPFVEAFSVQEVMGAGQTILIHFQVTTFINECPESEGKASALIANRFSQHHELDEDYGLTIITQGTAYFRTDLLYVGATLNPDTLRPFLFLPIPVGFKREHIQVQASSDGSSVSYAFADHQKTDHFVAGQEIGATSIQATYREALQSDPDPLQTAMDGVDRYFQLQWWASQGKKTGRSYTPKVEGGPIKGIKSDSIKRGGLGSSGSSFGAGSS